MLKLTVTYDIHTDVVPWILKSGLTPAECDDGSGRAVDVKAQTVNIESDGTIIYTWKGCRGNTCIGAYDPHTRKNKLLYSFDEEAQVVSCSVNMKWTLLAVSILQSRRNGDMPFRTAPRCLTLLIEIHPIHDIRVLKAVDCIVSVQFLYPVGKATLFPESHLLLISEDRYIDQIHISVVIQEGYRVLIKNTRLPTDRIIEDVTWAQWDMKEQRLYCAVTKVNCFLSVSKCIFYRFLFTSVGVCMKEMLCGGHHSVTVLL
ncbi:gamma-secretase-activating protein-like [Protopterus annectens]|uniref:gamma-secretase-activating protein-like n=1 Tax=Protopterus annectens TaxID=7888 RepID=UPI001CFBA2F9|nr:gamma-secretase-activating protein-like [Protopterus annectens]